MARGSGDLLFNPPALLKKDQGKESGRIRHGNFPASVESMFLLGEMILIEDDESDLLLIDSNRESTTKEIGIPHLQEGGLAFASDSGIAFGDHEGFIIFDREYQKIFKDPLPGKLLALHLSNDALYCFWCQEKSGSFYLSKTSRDIKSSRNWENVSSFSQENQAVFLNKGERSMIVSSQEPTATDQIISIGEEGMSNPLQVEADPFLTTPEINLITPADNCSYFALEKGRYGDEVTLIFQEKEGGPAARNRVISLIGREQENWKSIASYRGRGALLGERSVILFSQDGKSEEIPLDPIDRSFEEIVFNDEHILLWCPGSSAYLEIAV